MSKSSVYMFVVCADQSGPINCCGEIGYLCEVRWYRFVGILNQQWGGSIGANHVDVIPWKRFLHYCESIGERWIFLTNAGLRCFCWHEKAIQQPVEVSVIWDILVLRGRHCNDMISIIYDIFHKLSTQFCFSTFYCGSVLGFGASYGVLISGSEVISLPRLAEK